MGDYFMVLVDHSINMNNSIYNIENIIKNHDFILLDGKVLLDSLFCNALPFILFLLRKYQTKIILLEEDYQEIKQLKLYEEQRGKFEQASKAMLYLDRLCNKKLLIIDHDILSDTHNSSLEKMNKVFLKYFNDGINRVGIISKDRYLRIRINTHYRKRNIQDIAVGPEEIACKFKIMLEEIIDYFDIIWIDDPIWKDLDDIISSSELDRNVDLFSSLKECFKEKKKKFIIPKDQIEKIFNELLAKNAKEAGPDLLAINRLEILDSEGLLDIWAAPSNLDFVHSYVDDYSFVILEFLKFFAKNNKNICIFTKNINLRNIFERELTSIYVDVLFIDNLSILLLKNVENASDLVKLKSWSLEKVMQENEFVIFDTDIWVDQAQDAFFGALRSIMVKKKLSLNMPGFQFDDICNMKRRSAYNSLESTKSRIAINRVEILQETGYFNIIPIKKEPKYISSYIDELIKFIYEKTNLGIRICYISTNPYDRFKLRRKLIEKGISKELFKILDFWVCEFPEDDMTLESKEKSFISNYEIKFSLEDMIKASEYLIIDTNIWIDQYANVFFKKLETFLKKYGKKVYIPGFQLSELIHLKNKLSTNSDDKNEKIDLALERIERLQRMQLQQKQGDEGKDLVDIDQFSIMSKWESYADPRIISTLLEKKGKMGESVCLITNDRELRIRARQILKDEGIRSIVGGIPGYYEQPSLFEKIKQQIKRVLPSDKNSNIKMSHAFLAILGFIIALFADEQYRWFMVIGAGLLSAIFIPLFLLNKIKIRHIYKIIFWVCVILLLPSFIRIILFILAAIMKALIAIITYILWVIAKIFALFVIFGIIYSIISRK